MDRSDKVPDLREGAPNWSPSAHVPRTREPRAHRLPVLQHESDHHGYRDGAYEVLPDSLPALRHSEERQRLGDESSVAFEGVLARFSEWFRGRFNGELINRGALPSEVLENTIASGRVASS